MKWRLLTDNNVGHSQGLALDDALTQSAMDGCAGTLRLYTYENCVLLGRFQHAPSQINLDRCRRLNIPVNRRPSGGGAIVMGPQQAGIALVVPARSPGFSNNTSRLLQHLSCGIVNALRELGIESELVGKNDLSVGGKKISGLGLYRAQSGATLFHASLLLDLDIELMLSVLRTSYENYADRVGLVGSRLTTVRKELGSKIGMCDLMNLLRSGFERMLECEFEAAGANGSELVLAEQLCRDRYGCDNWVMQNASQVIDQVGKSLHRTAGGNLECRIIVAGNLLKSVFWGGDFITSDNAVSDLESSLRWHTIDLSVLRNTVFKSMCRHAGVWHRINVDDIVKALAKALQEAQRSECNQEPDPCFARLRSEQVA